MNAVGILALMLLTGAKPFPSPPPSATATRLVGLWTSQAPLWPEQPGDRLVLERTRPEAAHWYWGGLGSGFEFVPGGAFNEYENKGCSDESDPVRNDGERWRLDETRGQVVIEGGRRRMRLSVVTLGSRALVFRVDKVMSTSDP